MKRILLGAALAVLLGCGDPLEREVRAILADSEEILVPGTVELRKLHRSGLTICGKLSHESAHGRTPFLRFYIVGKELTVIPEDPVLVGSNYQIAEDMANRLFWERQCTTSQPAE